MAELGRPSDYDAVTGDRLCGLVAEGRSVRSICREYEWAPCLTTFYRWLRTFPAFAKQYETAKEESADALADDILDIADDENRDYKTVTDQNGTQVVIDKDNIQRARLKVDARKWIASKLKPRKYGDFSKSEISGPNGGPISVSLADQIRGASTDG